MNLNNKILIVFNVDFKKDVEILIQNCINYENQKPYQ